MEMSENMEKGTSVQQICPTEKNNYKAYPQILAGLLATLTLFAGGMGFNWPAIVLLRLDHLTSDEGAWIVSGLSLGACFGPILSANLTDRIGRKWFLYFCGVPYLLCWILMLVSESFVSLFVARIIFGIGVGGAFGVVPMYLGEIAEVRIRGRLGSMLAFNLTSGGLLIYCVSPWVDNKTVAIISMVPVILFLLTFAWMPETPYYYLKKNMPLEAEKSLSWLRRSNDVQEELRDMSVSIENELKNRGRVIELITVPGNRKATLIVFLIIAGQQCSGFIAFAAYATTLFAQSGLNFDPAYATIIMGSAAVLGSIFATCNIDRLGRRPLYLTSIFITIVGLFILALYFYLEQLGSEVRPIAWVPLTTTIVLQISFALGLAPIPYAVVAEIYPISVKASATMVVSVYGSILGVIISKLYQVISDSYGYPTLFLALCICEIVIAILVIIFLPETKGKSFTEIQNILNKKSKAEK